MARPTKAQAKARRASSLEASEQYQEFYQDAVDGAVKVFTKADSTADEIIEAHSTIKALDKLRVQFMRTRNAAKTEAAKAERTRD